MAWSILKCKSSSSPLMAGVQAGASSVLTLLALPEWIPNSSSSQKSTAWASQTWHPGIQIPNLLNSRVLSVSTELHPLLALIHWLWDRLDMVDRILHKTELGASRSYLLDFFFLAHSRSLSALLRIESQKPGPLHQKDKVSSWHDLNSRWSLHPTPEDKRGNGKVMVWSLEITLFSKVGQVQIPC